MRIAVMSDIHANFEAFSAVMSAIETEDIDEIIFLGDLVIKGPEPKECFHFMKQIKPTVWLKGNTDEWLENVENLNDNYLDGEQLEYYNYANEKLSNNNKRFLKNLKEKESIDVLDKKILCVHGSPKSNLDIMDSRKTDEELKELLKELEEDIIVCGHSHNSFLKYIEDKTIINVGSVGLPFDEIPKASFIVLDIRKNKEMGIEFKRIDYDIETNLLIAEENQFPDFEKYKKQIIDAKQ
ncbi:MAG: metallophosphoesterase family protein [Thermotogota bacterium]